MTIGSGTFQLTAKSRILATSPAARQIAKVLAADLAPSTGWHLRVGSGAAKAGDIQLILGNPGTLSDDTLHEGYQLNVNASVATLTAPTSDGLLNGVQTIRQLFPAWVDRSSVEPGPWTMPAVSITDYPRYAYRGT
jgi:hexosaminidase